MESRRFYLSLLKNIRGIKNNKSHEHSWLHNSAVDSLIDRELQSPHSLTGSILNQLVALTPNLSDYEDAFTNASSRIENARAFKLPWMKAAVNAKESLDDQQQAAVDQYNKLVKDGVISE